MKKKETDNKPQSKKDAQKKSGKFICLQHPEIRRSKPGVCPKCGVSLRLENKEPA